MKIGHRNTLSKILKYFLPTNIILEEKWAALERFLADIFYCLLHEVKMLKTSILRDNKISESS